MNNSINEKQSKLIISLMFTLMFLSTLNSLSDDLKTIGFISLFITLSLALLMLMFYLFNQKNLYLIQFKILIVSILLTLIMAIGLINTHNFKGLENLFQFISVISLFILVSLIKWNENKKKLAKIVVLILFLVILPLIGNQAFLGAYMILPMFFIFLDKKINLLNIVFLIVCIYFIINAGMRGVYVLLFVTFISFVLWPVISKNKLRMSFFFLSIFGVLLSFIYFYPKIIYWDKYPYIEEVIFKYTGKSILSGRNRLWEALIEIIVEKPFLGYGPGVLPRDFLDTQQSAHNLYLQTLLQNGLIGLILLIIIFYIIWISYYNSRTSFNTRLSASFFIGIIIYQSFEIVLTQNKMDTALFMWLIISVGVSESLYFNQKSILEE